MRLLALLVILGSVSPAFAAASGEVYRLRWAERAKGSTLGWDLFIRHLYCDFGGRCELTTIELRCIDEKLHTYFDVNATPPEGTLKVRRDGEWVHVEIDDPLAPETHELKVRKVQGGVPDVPQNDIFVTEASGTMILRNKDKIQTIEFEPITTSTALPESPGMLTESVYLPCPKVVVPALPKKKE